MQSLETIAGKTAIYRFSSSLEIGVDAMNQDLRISSGSRNPTVPGTPSFLDREWANAQFAKRSEA
jgi:hypothetical protein